MSNKPDIYWGSDLREEIGNTLLIAQNALVGYVQLTNDDEMHERNDAAKDALDAVRQAIRKGRVLEQQGIVAGGRGR